MAYKRISPVPVIEGGTGIITATTAYAPIIAGTTATGAFQIANGGAGLTGQVLTSQGAAALPIWAAAGTFNYTSVVFGASPYTVLTTDNFIGVVSAGGAITIKLPNGPGTGTVWDIKDVSGSAASNNITVTTVGGAVTIDGATSFVMNTAYQSISVLFNGTSYFVF